MATIQATNLTHAEVTQTTLEEVDFDLLETLASVLDQLDDTSTMSGTLHSSYAFKDSVDKLQAKFSTLHINYDNRLLRFLENQNLLSSLLTQIDSNNDSVLGVNELASALSIVLNDNVASLRESAEFPNILTLMSALQNLKGGTNLSGDVNISSNSNIKTINMSGTDTHNIEGISNKSQLSNVQYHTPTKVSVSSCPELDIDNPTQEVTMNSDEIDQLAHDVCGTPLSLEDDGTPTATLPESLTINIDGNYYSDSVAALNDEGVTFQGGNTTLQRILDPAVKEVLVSKMGASAIEDGNIKEDSFKELTDIDTWFYGNKNIKTFKELSKTKITWLNWYAFKYCTNLLYLDLSKIKNIGPYPFSGCPNLKFIFLPNVEVSGTSIATNLLDTNTSLVVADIGKKQTKIGYIASNYTNYDTKFVLRYSGVVEFVGFYHSGLSSNARVFVVEDYVDSYKTATNWSTYASKIFPIGGTEWQTTMQSLAQEENYTLQEGESWADEYIDYKIYGIEPPTEETT